MDLKITDKEIFLFEYISGGGYSGEIVSDSLLSEGFGMLSALTFDFASLGFDIKLILDYRLNQEIDDLKHRIEEYLRNINKSSVVISYDLVQGLEDLDIKFEKFVKSTSYFMIIAPECGNILYNYVKKAESIIFENKKGQMLNPSSEFILIFSDKRLSEKYFSSSIIQIPKSLSIDEFLKYCKKKAMKLIEKRKNEQIITINNDGINENFILKPIDGVGCLDTFEIAIDFKKFLNSDENSAVLISEIKKIIEYIRSNFPQETFIIQKKIDGIPLSISEINRHGELAFFSINQQLIDFAPVEDMKNNKFTKFLKLDYLGGITPYTELPKNIIQQLKDISESLCDDFPFSGFFGIDLIMNPKDKLIKIIEINPRVTTPYIAYSELFRKMSLNENIAALLFSGDFNENKKAIEGIPVKCIYKKSKITGGMDIFFE